ncbi:MAG: AtpZ/AtpI family protein [Synergistaceae bacterium]|nr:AtpZ/AtpI family protein [Synergistaceae bacterium]
MSQIGFMVAACILTGVLLGRFLDGVFNTSPWLVLLFSLLGTGAAFKYLMEFTKRM